MPYQILIKPAALKQLTALQQRDRTALAARIDALAENPRPPDCKKLKGESDLYRIRHGDIRVIYQVKDRILIVLVLAVGGRGGIYERLRRK